MHKHEHHKKMAEVHEHEMHKHKERTEHHKGHKEHHEARAHESKKEMDGESHAFKGHKDGEMKGRFHNAVMKKGE